MRKELIFSTGHILAELLVARSIEIEGTAIIFNLSNHPIRLGGEPANSIAPYTSEMISNIDISAELAVIIRILDREGLAAECMDSWNNYHSYNADFPSSAMLFRSAQQTVGTTQFNPINFGQNTFDQGPQQKFEVKLNLWYTPSNNDCKIHNEHDFLEIHTQLYGTGHMQAFTNTDEKSIYLNHTMNEGRTHSPWFSYNREGKIVYPWHRYLSGTDCIWMAIEFHPIT